MAKQSSLVVARLTDFIRKSGAFVQVSTNIVNATDGAVVVLARPSMNGLDNCGGTLVCRPLLRPAAPFDFFVRHILHGWIDN